MYKEYQERNQIRGIQHLWMPLVFLVIFLGATIQSSGQGYGKITGKITYEGGHVKVVKKVIKDEHTCGSNDIIDESLLTSDDGGLQWAVVSISTPVKNGKDMSKLPGDHTLDQRTCVFKPHIVLVGVNEPLKIMNSDHTLHNVRTTSFMNDNFSKAQIYIPGQPAPVDEVVFSEPEIIESVCDVHGWMKAYIVVVDHPYYSVTDENGMFELDEVPTGTYTITVWHEKLGEQKITVTVSAGKTSEINLTFKK
jgi:plastocyanin